MRIPRGGAIAVVLCAWPACDTHTGARVVVRDSGGAIVKDAIVRLVPEDSGIVGEGVIRKDGSYTVGRTHGPRAGSFQLTVEKGGYRPYRAQLRAGVRYNCEITLASDTESWGQCNLRPEKVR